MTCRCSSGTHDGANAPPGEHVLVDVGLEERPQELPGPVAPLVRLVDTDVAPPDHVQAPRRQPHGQPGGLGVVQHDDVARRRHRGQLGGVPLQDLLVVVDLVRTERSPVPGLAVEPVVDPLRDREELGIAVEHHPARVHTERAGVPEDGVEHLRDTAPARGGADVPQAPGAERLAGRGQRLR
ncbi:MAG: hypothetical protein U5R31_15905 [Acidimicrobiia bacterium]|nr:hypothetical protein [Acidimicrobiia bacterium]